MRMKLWPAILRPWPWMVKILDTDREKYSSQAKIFQTRAQAATGACTAAVPGAGQGAWQLWPPSPTPAPTSPPASTLASTQVLCSKHQIFLLSMHLFSYFPSKYFFFKIFLWSSGKGKGKGWTQEGYWKVIYGWWMVDGGIPFPDALH